MGAPRRPLPRRPLPTTAAPRGAGQAILAIEPHPPLADLIGEALRDEGYRPVLAASLPEAVTHLGAERFALVLADPLRPEYASTGMLTRPWSHLERIQALAGDTPIVICTAYSAWAFADYRRRGFGDLLLKPFTLRDLLAAVRRNLAHENPGPAAPQGDLGLPPTAE
jgi:CheY-like chemotaxis protein